MSMLYLKSIDMNKCPQHYRGSTARYLTHGCSPGGFLAAVFRNDLKEAFNRGDDTSIFFLKELMVFLYNNVPSACYGSPESFCNWKGINNDPELREIMEVKNAD